MSTSQAAPRSGALEVLNKAVKGGASRAPGGVLWLNGQSAPPSEPSTPPDQLRKSADDARAAGRHDEASAIYRKLLAANPDDADACYWQGFCLSELGDTEGAIAHYERAGRLEPKWAKVQNSIGLLRRRGGDNEAALAAFLAAIQISPRFAAAHANLAYLLRKLGRLAESAAHYRRAIESRPEWAEMYEELAHVLSDDQCLAEAHMAVREAIRLCPVRVSAHCTLATILSWRGKHDEAEATLLSLIDAARGDASLWSRLATVRRNAGRWDGAKSAAEEAISRDPSLPYPWFVLGQVAEKREEPEAAIRHFRRYLELSPTDAGGATLHLSRLGAEPAPDRAPTDYVKQLYAYRSGFWDNGGDTYRAPALVVEALEECWSTGGDLAVLDAGCGTGLCGAGLRPKVRRLDGLDLSAHMITKAREKGFYDDLTIGDLESVMLARPAQYDAVVCAATLIHFGDLAGPLTAAATTLRPGGWMSFTVFPNEGEGIGVMPFFCHSHSREHIRDRAVAAGFDVIAIRNETHEHHKGRPVQCHLVVLRRRPDGR